VTGTALYGGPAYAFPLPGSARGTPHRGMTPVLAGRDPGNRGAPARGVDVKPLRQTGPGGPKNPKNPVFGVYPPKSPILGILAKNSQKWLFFRKKQLAS